MTHLDTLNPIDLHFYGPLSFWPGERSLFHCSLRDKPSIYLWTFKSESDGQYYVHYVGETWSFAKRQREHLVNILGMNYGTFDPAAARRGEQTRLWPGLWRDKTPDGPARLLERYAENASAVLEYVKAMDVFVAEVHVDKNLRKHIEGSIGWNIRNNHQDKKMLYPDDNHVGTGGRTGRQLRITADAPIAGLDVVLDI